MALRQSTSTVEVEAWTGGVQLPSEPAGICHPDLQAQIDRLYRKKVEQGYDMNTFIQNNKAFRNPSIYEKLIQGSGQQSRLSSYFVAISVLKKFEPKFHFHFNWQIKMPIGPIRKLN